MEFFSFKSVLYSIILAFILSSTKHSTSVWGKVKKTNTKRENSTVEDAIESGLKDIIQQIDKHGDLQKILIWRRMHIPKDSSMSFTSQVSRPNMFPNIFNQGEGFIMDAVCEWPMWMDLHGFAEAMYHYSLQEGGAEGHHGHHDKGISGVTRSEVDEIEELSIEYEDSEIEVEDEEQWSPKSMSGIIGVERCLIYDKVETGMSLYLDISRDQSHDCVLRGICEAQLVADHYPDNPSSVFFEVIHLILKPSLGTYDTCYEDYIKAEKAAHSAPLHCSEYVSKCPVNVAGLFVRNFFPDFL